MPDLELKKSKPKGSKKRSSNKESSVRKSSDNLKKLVLSSLEDLKGQSIACLDVSKLSNFTDYMIVVTGTSSRHLKALADEASKKVKESDQQVLGIEGQDGGEWILLDLGDVIVHIMLAATRQLYDLESLWSIGVNRSE